VHTFKLKYKTRVLLSILLGVIFFSCHPKDAYRVAVFKTGDGWGYRIESKEKVYIEQPFIPAIEGTYTFKTKEEAMRTGSLVLQKLKDGKNPAVYRQELDSLQISYPKR
jgi:hypothetical protein